jgi:hypothetical protein
MPRRVYVRPWNPYRDIGFSLLEIAKNVVILVGVLVSFPLIIAFAILKGLTGGPHRSYQRFRPRQRRTWE